MRLIIAAVGRLKNNAERHLYDCYATRFDSCGRALGLGPITLLEISEARAATAPLRKADEAQRLLKAASAADVTATLEQQGHSLTSGEFARLIAKQRDEGARTMAFLIGGPDGHGETAVKDATMKLSLGPMTLPHGLARVVLAEQLYRAATILAGHPYHRA